MLAKINFNDTARWAVVFGENFSYSTLAKARKALVDLVEHLENGDGEGKCLAEKAYAILLANEMRMVESGTETYGNDIDV